MTPPETNDSFAEEVEDRLEKLFGEDFLADDDSAEAVDESKDLAADDAFSITEDDADDQIPEHAESIDVEDLQESVPDVFEDIAAEDAEFIESDAGDAEEIEDESDPLPDETLMVSGEAPESDSDSSDDLPLRELQAIVLSIDWEINDDVMTRFVEQLAVLKDNFKEDKIVLVFLQLLNSIGEYIRVNLGRSHPDAFKILNSLFLQLNNVVNSPTMTGAEKKQTLAAELEKYKNLKSKLTPEPAAADNRVKTPSQDETPAADIDIRKLYSAVDELKKMLQADIRSLKEEIHLIKNLLAKRG